MFHSTFARLLSRPPFAFARGMFPALFCLMPFLATTVHGVAVNLTWADNSTNETGFKIERASGTGAFSQVSTTGPNVQSYVDASVATNATYRYRVRAYNTTGNSGYSNTVSVNTGGSSSGNTAPTISTLSNRTIAMNSTTGPLSFTIGDAQTSAASLSLIKNSSNQVLVPLANITFGGSGANRTVTVRPASNQSGWSTIWVKVSDGQLERFTSFTLTVDGRASTNTAPTISPIAHRTIAVNGTTGAIPFTIGDAQTAASRLTLIKNSSNQSLVPLANITFGGSSANRTVTVRPASNQTGWSTVWVKVSDGLLSQYVSFVVTIRAGQTTATINAASSTIPGAPAAALKSAAATLGEIRFSYAGLTGDAELTVRVTSLADRSDQTRAGLMFRNSTAEDAAFVGVFVTGSSRLLWVWRSATGASLETVGLLDGATPCWLRLTRTGDGFYGFTSQDGETWELVDFANVDLAETALGGTVVTTIGPVSETTASFETLVVD